MIRAPGGGYWVRWWPAGVAADEIHPAPAAVTVEFDDRQMFPKSGMNGHDTHYASGKVMHISGTNGWHYPIRVDWQPPTASIGADPAHGGRAVTVIGYEYAWRNKAGGGFLTEAKRVSARTRNSGWQHADVEPTNLRKAAGHPTAALYRDSNRLRTNVVKVAVRAQYSDNRWSAWAYSPEVKAPRAKNVVMAVAASGTKANTSWWHRVSGVMGRLTSRDYAGIQGSPQIKWISGTIKSNLVNQCITITFANRSNTTPVIGRTCGPISDLTETYWYFAPITLWLLNGKPLTVHQRSNWQSYIDKQTAAHVLAHHREHSGWMDVGPMRVNASLETWHLSTRGANSNINPAIKAIGDWARREIGHHKRDNSNVLAACFDGNGNTYTADNSHMSAGSKPGQIVMMQGQAVDGTIVTTLHAYGLYGGDKEYATGVKLHSGAHAHATATGAHHDTAAVRYERSGTHHNGGGLNHASTRIAPTSGGMPVVPSYPNAGYFHASATARIHSVIFDAHSTPNVGLTSASREVWVQVSPDGRNWVFAGKAPAGSSGRTTVITFPRQPGGTYFRIVAVGRGWRSSRSSSGPQLVVSKAVWESGG